MALIIDHGKSAPRLPVEDIVESEPAHRPCRWETLLMCLDFVSKHAWGNTLVVFLVSSDAYNVSVAGCLQKLLYIHGITVTPVLIDDLLTEYNPDNPELTSRSCHFFTDVAGSAPRDRVLAVFGHPLADVLSLLRYIHSQHMVHASLTFSNMPHQCLPHIPYGVELYFPCFCTKPMDKGVWCHVLTDRKRAGIDLVGLRQELTAYHFVTRGVQPDEDRKHDKQQEQRIFDLFKARFNVKLSDSQLRLLCVKNMDPG